MKFGLAAKFTLALIAVVAIVILGALGYLRWSAEQAFEREFSRQVADLTDRSTRLYEGLETRLTRSVERVGTLEDVQYLAQDLERGVYWGDPEKRREFESLLPQLLRDSDLDLLFFVDRLDSGRVVGMAHRQGVAPPDEDAIARLERGERTLFVRSARIEDGPSLRQVPSFQCVRAAGPALALVGGWVIDSERMSQLVPDAGPGVHVALVSAAGEPLAERGGSDSGAAAVQQDIPLASYDGAPRLEARVSTAPLDANRETLVQATLLASGLGLLVALLLGVWMSRQLTSPIRSLARATATVAQGNWEQTVADRGRRDEVGDLLRSFNAMTRELASTQKRAVQAERLAAWRHVARQIAHEIKNPLFPIQMSIETVQRARRKSHPDFDVIFDEAAETVLVEVERMKRIVTEFSEFARMPRPQLGNVSLVEYLEHFRRLYQHIEPPLEVQWVEQSGPSEVLADEEQLTSLLGNLVQNAVDASPEGGRIALVIAGDDRGWSMAVHDGGRGISDEVRETLFDPYVTTKSKGTGLGLAIAQKIAIEHRGELSVEPSIFGGACFRLWLPRADTRVAYGAGD